MKQYLAQGLYPIFAPVPGSQYVSTLTAEEQLQVLQEHGTASLRQLAHRYNVSHETIRQVAARDV